MSKLITKIKQAEREGRTKYGGRAFHIYIEGEEKKSCFHCGKVKNK